MEHIHNTPRQITTEQISNMLFTRLVDTGWGSLIRSYFRETNGQKLLHNLVQDVELKGDRFTPPLKHIFTCLQDCTRPTVRVVWLGAKPYCGLNTYTGTPFTRKLYPGTTRRPPLLTHLLADLPDSADLPFHQQADLSRWSKQGVLLLPEGFTTPLAQPTRTHLDRWRELLLRLVDTLSAQEKPLAFLLLGEAGRYYEDLIGEQHAVFWAEQPVTSMARKEPHWSGQAVLAQINTWLTGKNEPPIAW